MALTSKRQPMTAAEVARKQGFMSGLEERVARDLEARGVAAEYEMYTIHFTVPERKTRYTPDFVLPNGIIIETKGRFVTKDRQHLLLVKAQFPDLDIRLLFTNPKARISKTSLTTYAAWCEHHGFQYAKQLAPQSWLDEPVGKKRLAAIQQWKRQTTKRSK